MQKFKQEQYRCAVGKALVTITSQRYRFFGGLGDISNHKQVDYQCSIDEDCKHGMESLCPVQRLNENRQFS